MQKTGDNTIYIYERNAAHAAFLSLYFAAYSVDGKTFPIEIHTAPPDESLLESAPAYVIALGETSETTFDFVMPKPYRFGYLLDIIDRFSHTAGNAGQIQMGNFTLDLAQRSFYSALDQQDPIKLTEKETQILALLYKVGGIMHRDAMLAEIWGYGENIDTHTLETHIYRLRQKIEPNPSAPSILLTEDDGYRLQYE